MPWDALPITVDYWPPTTYYAAVLFPHRKGALERTSFSDSNF
jgi:hypothetical protein